MQPGQGAIAISSGSGDEWYAAASAHARSLPPALRPAARLATHIEVKVAVQMRQEARQEETVVIDRPVCGTRANDRQAPFTCDKMLKWFLPPGARLTVVEHDGTSRTYQGRATA